MSERLIGVMVLVAIFLSVITFVDGYARESARRAQCGEVARDQQH